MLGFEGLAQASPTLGNESDSLLTKKIIVAGGTALGVGITTYGLSKAWYAEYKTVPFHWFNDQNQWLQMDKAGHLLTCYHFGMGAYEAFKWAGFNENISLWIGGNTGFALMLGVEYLDGKSSGWGASASDLAANGIGSLLFISQQKLWHQQKITPKFSFSRSPYAVMNPSLLGDGIQEEWLKDYNGQTYWLSFNLKSFAQNTQVPAWLNLAIGYGSEGLLRGKAADQYASEFSEIERKRQFYLSLDADLWRIKTRSKALKAGFRILSFIKIPAPGLEMNDHGRMKFQWISF